MITRGCRAEFPNFPRALTEQTARSRAATLIRHSNPDRARPPRSEQVFEGLRTRIAVDSRGERKPVNCWNVLMRDPHLDVFSALN